MSSSFNKLKFLLLLMVLGLSATFFLSFPDTFSHRQAVAASLCFVTICMWATGIMPEFITSLFFFLTAMLLSLAPAEVIFAGFTSSAVWLIFGGLVLGVAISVTGLGKRTAGVVAAHLHGSYTGIIGGLVAGGVFFSFLMPSAMGRVVLLTPIAVSMAGHFGFKPGSNGRTGVILAVIMGSFLPAFSILPANVPNMVLVGMVENQFHISLLYGQYLLFHFPVMGMVKALLTVLVIVRLFPDEPDELRSEEVSGEEPMSRQERILAATLLVLLFLWVTDFLHHISPAWIALAGALFMLFPGVSIVTTSMFNQKLNWASIIFVAGILGLGTFISYSGLGSMLAAELIKILPLQQGSDFANYFSITIAAAVTGIFTTLPGVPAVFTPFSSALSQASGMTVEKVIMLQVLGFSTVFFPYQAPPIVVGMQLSGEKFSNALKFCLIMALLTVFFLLPLDFLWWKVLGGFDIETW